MRDTVAVSAITRTKAEVLDVEIRVGKAFTAYEKQQITFAELKILVDKIRYDRI
jgi:hypothetical protein